MSYLVCLSFFIQYVVLYVFRVSFGSSKGSMVETLIYDSPPVQEELIDPSDVDDSDGYVIYL